MKNSLERTDQLAMDSNATNSNSLVQHYTPGNLLEVIQQAIKAIGKTPETITVDDLAAMDEFHVGSREATRSLLEPLSLSSKHHLLDVGCGVGGSARYIASEFGCTVTGVDLTSEFVEVGRQICGWMGLHNRVFLQQGSALELAMDDASFDGAYMIHVGMNIDNKENLFRTLFPMIKKGGFIAIYDLMQIGSGEITFPVPWAGSEENSYVERPREYESALQRAGFKIERVRNRHQFALDFYSRVKTKLAEDGPQPFGLHQLMGEQTELRLSNAYQAIITGGIAPVEIVAQK